MARLVTLIALRNRIRARANVRSVKFTDNILNDWINEAVLATLDVILSKNPTYSLTSTDWDIVSGQDYVTMSTLVGETVTYPVYKLHGVRVKDSDGQYKRIDRFSWEDQLDQVTNLTDRLALRYHWDSGWTLRFQTAPGWSETDGLRVKYIPVPAALSADGDTWDGVFGWDEHVVCQVAMQIRDAKEMDTSSIAAMLAMAERRIERRAVLRDVVNPPRMRDARGFKRRSNLPWPT